MAAQTRTTERIFRRFKDLRQHLQAGEIPLYTVPAIWDGGRERRSAACDIIITNQRIFGYIYLRFPRERLFLDALPLDAIKSISLRQKSFEPVFREMSITADKRTVYIRAPRQKIESLYDALRSATREARVAETLPDDDAASTFVASLAPHAAPAFGKQEMRASFERSSLAILLLFIGGLVLEITGALLWLGTQSAPTGLPLCIAGFVAVVTAILILRQR
jgi:hypothetical protein